MSKKPLAPPPKDDDNYDDYDDGESRGAQAVDGSSRRLSGQDRSQDCDR